MDWRWASRELIASNPWNSRSLRPFLQLQKFRCTPHLHRRNAGPGRIGGPFHLQEETRDEDLSWQRERRSIPQRRRSPRKKRELQSCRRLKSPVSVHSRGTVFLLHDVEAVDSRRVCRGTACGKLP